MTALRRLLNNCGKFLLIPMLSLQLFLKSLSLLRSLVSNLLVLCLSLLILPLAFILDIALIIFAGFEAIRKTLLRSF